MNEIILHGHISSLAGVIETLGHNPPPFLFLEQVPTEWLAPTAIQDGISFRLYEPDLDFSRWQRGRAFCAHWELCWEGPLLVYTGTDASLDGFTPGPSLDDCERRIATCLLWGARDGSAFSELQIPRRLTYPISGGLRALLQVIEWYDPAGHLVASRAAGLEVR